ncbi:hypothetical protein NLG97_g1740 [Lecanicillium saksenae]|uniref:Uncharacterized protein n=1 Tax=Lecanicillium saksenae TaxID=468837 RepID=A0ACC1R4T2_9HYPO|nr:hypothetical protein NLG97_g1740 [Lecanicillium saksenae]
MPPYNDILVAHQREALDRLICGDMHELDPCIGDMSCQMRVPFILDMYWTVQSQLREKRLLKCMPESLQQFNHGEQCASYRAGSSEPGRLAVLRTWRHYDSVVTDIRQLLGKDNLELLGLCYSLTTSNVFSYDEFGTYFYFIYLGTFGGATHRHDYNRELDSDNQLPILRQKLAAGNLAYFRGVVKRLANGDTQQFIEAKQDDYRESVGWQLHEAVRRLSSAIEQRHPTAGSIPLIACQPQIKAVLLHEFARGRALVVVVRRLKINCCTDTRLTYTLTEVRCLYYTPNSETGAFEPVSDVEPALQNTPCLAFNCWSTYVDSQPGSGLDSSDDAEYFNALARSDISWLITVYANVHPPFASKSSATAEDLRSTYADICGSSVRRFDYSREQCRGFDLRVQPSRDARPSLYEELVMSDQLAQSHDFANARLIPMGAKSRNCYLRIGLAVDFAVEHVKASSFGRASAFCAGLKRRHASAGQAVIGQFVVRIGRHGVSCTDDNFARTLSGIRNNKKKWDRYASEHVQNLVFYDESAPLTL